MPASGGKPAFSNQNVTLAPAESIRTGRYLTVGRSFAGMHFSPYRVCSAQADVLPMNERYAEWSGGMDRGAVRVPDGRGNNGLRTMQSRRRSASWIC